ncbi:MAG: hypothetical protein AB1656_17705 [Candidatus Omnitrophota bacterium]
MYHEFILNIIIGQITTLHHEILELDNFDGNENIAYKIVRQKIKKLEFLVYLNNHDLWNDSESSIGAIENMIQKSKSFDKDHYQEYIVNVLKKILEITKDPTVKKVCENNIKYFEFLFIPPQED